MPIKLVAIDMDGTLLNEHSRINPKVCETIKQAKAKGVKIVLCTGRPLPGVSEHLATLGLTDSEDYVVTYNGGLVLNTHTQEVIACHTLSHDDYLQIDTLARQLKVHLHTTTEDTIYTSNRDISPYTVHEAYLVNMPIKYRTPEEITEELKIIKMMMIDEPEILSRAIKQIPSAFHENYTMVQSAPYFYEFLNKQTNKGEALKELAEYLGIKQAEVMAIGDAENDLAMIRYAGLGIAMGNGTPDVKTAADQIVATNQEDGVSEAIEKFVF